METAAESRVGGDNVRVGPAGWSYPDWEGRVYPRGTRDRLGFIARHFTMVEVNSSFYATPDPRTTEKWCATVADRPDFRFTVKLFQGFTHQKDGADRDEEKRFAAALGPLAESGRLGALLVQFPWSFRDWPENRQKIVGLAQRFRRYRPVMEVRHGSWASRSAADFFTGLDVGWCSIDQPMVGEALEGTSIATGPVGYVRFHGRNRENWFSKEADRNSRYDYLYSDKELSSWKERIRRIAGRSKETFVVTNNHFLGQAVVNGLELLHMVNGKKVLVPDPLAARHPRLAKIRAYPPGSQPGLF